MRICGEIPSVALHDLYFLYMRCTKNAQANVSRGRWFRHSIYPDGHVSMAALVRTGRHVVKWPEFRAFHD